MIKFNTILMLTLAFACSATSVQAEYPEKPVEFVVPWPPGDLEDILTRMIAEDFQETYGVPAAVLNKPGGGGGPFPGAIEVANMAESLPFPDDSFAAFTCIGAFGPGHAPPASLNELARVTRPGGIGVFNLISATWEEQGFPAVIDALKDAGRWEQVQVSAHFRPYLLGEPELWSRLHVMRML